MVYLFAIGIALAVWEIAVGLNKGQISGLGQVFVKARRDTQPIRFWLLLAFNATFLAAFIILFVHELRQ